MNKALFIKAMQSICGEGVDPYEIKKLLEKELGITMTNEETFLYCKQEVGTGDSLKTALKILQGVYDEGDGPSPSDTILIEGSIVFGKRVSGRRHDTSGAHSVESNIIRREKE